MRKQIHLCLSVSCQWRHCILVSSSQFDVFVLSHPPANRKLSISIHGGQKALSCSRYSLRFHRGLYNWREEGETPPGEVSWHNKREEAASREQWDEARQICCSSWARAHERQHEGVIVSHPWLCDVESTNCSDILYKVNRGNWIHCLMLGVLTALVTVSLLYCLWVKPTDDLIWKSATHSPKRPPHSLYSHDDMTGICCFSPPQFVQKNPETNTECSQNDEMCFAVLCDTRNMALHFCLSSFK